MKIVNVCKNILFFGVCHIYASDTRILATTHFYILQIPCSLFTILLQKTAKPSLLLVETSFPNSSGFQNGS